MMVTSAVPLKPSRLGMNLRAFTSVAPVAPKAREP